MTRHLFLIAVTASAVALVAGCGPGDAQSKMIAESNKTNLQRLSNLYMKYQSRNGWKGPKDEATFKAFIQGDDPTSLKDMGVNPAALDTLFVSERDQQPFKVRYAVAGGMGATDAVVFETVGAGGRRQVGFTGMTVEEVDEARWNELFAGKGKPPNPQGVGRPSGGPPPGAQGGR